MLDYLFRRFLTILFLMWLMTVIIFALVSVAGGGIERVFNLQEFSPFKVVRLKSELNLDCSPGQQYFVWLGQLLKGDLGVAGGDRFGGIPITKLLAPKIQASLMLIGAAMFLSVVVGFLLGTVSALRPDGVLARLINAITVIGVSIPDFAVGTLLIIIFAVNFRWLPTSGMESLLFDPSPWELAADRLRHLTLPAVTLAFAYIATFARQFQSSLRRVMGEDYIRTARAKGLSSLRVFGKHALRNSFIPVLASIFSSMPSFLGGMVVVECLFSWPGIGWLIYKNISGGALSGGDFYVVLIIVGASAAISLFLSFLSDLLYALVDPRITSPVQSDQPMGGVVKKVVLVLMIALAGVIAYNWRLYAFYRSSSTALAVIIGFFAVLIGWAVYLERKSSHKRSALRSPVGKRGSDTNLPAFNLQLFQFHRRSVADLGKHLLKPSVAISIVFLAAILLLSFYPRLLGYSTVEDFPVHPRSQFEPPSLSNPLGTNSLGQSVLMLIIMLTGSTLQFALYITLIGAVGGTGIGVMIGFFKGALDKLVTVIFDLVSSIPSFFLVFLVLGIAGRSTGPVILTLSVFGLVEFARVVRARVLVVRELNYVEAARATGNSELQIVAKHLFRNLIPLIWEQGAILFARNLLLLSSLAFLKVLPVPTWGSLVADGQGSLYHWWVGVFPTVAIFASVLAITTVGKGVARGLDPFAKER